ncbi:hypothetical protein A8B98_14465 [Hymenobacter sp. UV11]|nr:hypothetical protein A8B98_14465 [Hymenobacter sp. UV11]
MYLTNLVSWKRGCRWLIWGISMAHHTDPLVFDLLNPLYALETHLQGTFGAKRSEGDFRSLPSFYQVTGNSLRTAVLLVSMAIKITISLHRYPHPIMAG